MIFTNLKPNIRFSNKIYSSKKDLENKNTKFQTMDDLCLKPGKMSQSSPTVEGSAKKDKHLRQNSSGNLVENVMRQGSDKLNGSDRKKIRLGVCAMEKKTSCKPMQEILDRISATGDIVVTIFPEQMILYMPVQVS